MDTVSGISPDICKGVFQSVTMTGEAACHRREGQLRGREQVRLGTSARFPDLCRFTRSSGHPAFSLGLSQTFGGLSEAHGAAACLPAGRPWASSRKRSLSITQVDGLKIQCRLKHLCVILERASFSHQDAKAGCSPPGWQVSAVTPTPPSRSGEHGRS